jgi:type IV pilus assembly protein PilE
MAHVGQRHTATGGYPWGGGFTLVEVMIVVAIIALISAIGVPLYTGYVTTAEGSATRLNAEPLRLALEDYFLDYQTYIEGKWIPDGAQTLESGGLGWQPDGDHSNYDYNVSAGATGSIADSYELTVTSRSNSAIVTTCNRNQPEGTFDCVTASP